MLNDSLQQYHFASRQTELKLILYNSGNIFIGVYIFQAVKDVLLLHVTTIRN